MKNYPLSDCILCHSAVEDPGFVCNACHKKQADEPDFYDEEMRRAFREALDEDYPDSDESYP